MMFPYVGSMRVNFYIWHIQHQAIIFKGWLSGLFHQKNEKRKEKRGKK